MRRLERVVVTGLAVHRITRLITTDRITAAPRELVLQQIYRLAGRHLAEPNGKRPRGTVPHDGDAPPLATLITCPWCMSIWVLAGVAAADVFVPHVWNRAAEAAAAATISGVVAEWVANYS